MIFNRWRVSVIVCITLSSVAISPPVFSDYLIACGSPKVLTIEFPDGTTLSTTVDSDDVYRYFDSKKLPDGVRADKYKIDCFVYAGFFKLGVAFNAISEFKRVGTIRTHYRNVVITEINGIKNTQTHSWVVFVNSVRLKKFNIDTLVEQCQHRSITYKFLPNS